MCGGGLHVGVCVLYVSEVGMCYSGLVLVCDS